MQNVQRYRLLFSSSVEEFRTMLKQISKESKNVGLGINLMKIKNATNIREQILIAKNLTEYTNEYIYLEQSIFFVTNYLGGGIYGYRPTENKSPVKTEI